MSNAVTYTKRGNRVNFLSDLTGIRCIVGDKGSRVMDKCYSHRNKLSIMAKIVRNGW